MKRFKMFKIDGGNIKSNQTDLILGPESKKKTVDIFFIWKGFRWVSALKANNKITFQVLKQDSNKFFEWKKQNEKENSLNYYYFTSIVYSSIVECNFHSRKHIFRIYDIEETYTVN